MAYIERFDVRCSISVLEPIAATVPGETAQPTTGPEPAKPVDYTAFLPELDEVLWCSQRLASLMRDCSIWPATSASRSRA